MWEIKPFIKQVVELNEWFHNHFKNRKCFIIDCYSFEFLLMKLSDLKQGERGKIKCFQSSDLELKLMEMGCLPGEEVIVEQVAPLGDPISIRISGYLLSLRLNEANQIILDN